MAIAEYSCDLKDRLPYRIAFYSIESEWHADMDYYRDVARKEIALWCTGILGSGGVAWRQGFSCKRGTWGYCYNFLNEEDAMLFKLAWG